MSKIRIKQIRSVIGHPQSQKDTVRSLGLRRMNMVVEKEVNPTTLGMIRKVSHLVSVEHV
jgi:large subunit ribosomal protein L30